MPLSRDEVIAAYRFLLERDPENFAVVDDHCRVADWRTLRDLFTRSAEYRALVFRSIGHETIGRHLDAVGNDIQVDADEAERKAMFDRISTNWRIFGETEPHWSVITNPLFRSDSIEENMAPFLASGSADVDRLLALPGRAGIAPGAYRRALDFGCGVGRLSVALADHADAVVGVDISAGHLREAEKIAAANGRDNIVFTQIEGIDDLDGLGTFDLVVSRIVLQHNPPPIMAAIYRKLLQRLAPGGVAVVQLPTYISGYRFQVREYLDGTSPTMEMNALPQDVIFRIIAEEGCRAIEVREDDHLGAVDGLSHVFAVLRPDEAGTPDRGSSATVAA